jgi:hypothetical protein
VHARTEDAADSALRDVLAAYEIGDEAPRPRPVLLEIVD